MISCKTKVNSGSLADGLPPTIDRDRYTTPDQPMTLPRISSSLNPHASEFTAPFLRDGIGYYSDIQISAEMEKTYEDRKRQNPCINCPPYGDGEVLPAPDEMQPTPLVPDVMIEEDNKALFKPKTSPTQRSVPAVANSNQIERLPQVDRFPFRTVSYEAAK